MRLVLDSARATPGPCGHLRIEPAGGSFCLSERKEKKGRGEEDRERGRREGRRERNKEKNSPASKRLNPELPFDPKSKSYMSNQDK